MEEQQSLSTENAHRLNYSSSDIHTDTCESSVMQLMDEFEKPCSKAQIDLTMSQEDLPQDGAISLSASTTSNQFRTASPSMNRPIRSHNSSTSIINGPGLAKPMMNTSNDETNGKTRIDAALEKNLQTIATQVRRTNNTATAQLNNNDLQLFDNPNSTLNNKTMENSRELTPDSIIDESSLNMNSMPSVPSNIYSQLGWPPAPIYPFANQHPGLFYPFGPMATPNPTISSYYPTLIDQHFNPQGLAAFYSQQQAAARLFQEQQHPSSQSDSFPSVLQTTMNANAATREQIDRSTAGSCTTMPLFTHQAQQEFRSKKTSVNNSHQTTFPSAFHQLNINEQFSRLSPDLSSDGDGGATNDADSILSFESQKSNTMPSMPVLEDGLSDSENLSSDEPSPSVRNKSKESTSSATQQSVPQNVPKASTLPPKSAPVPQSANRSTSFHPQNEASAINTDDRKVIRKKDYDTDEETDKLLGMEHRMNARNQEIRDAAISRPPRRRQGQRHVIADPENSSVLIEGVLYRCRYLGSTQLMIDRNPTKLSRMMQAQEVVERIKAPDGENQPSVDVDLFVSTEKIMVLNTDLEDILMDHSLRSISYIADIGDLVVLMAKRRYLQHEDSDDGNSSSAMNSRRVVTFNQKMVCHVFESDEAQSIANSIGEAFQVAYIEFLKANGIDDPSFTRDIDYQEVLEQQEMCSEELERFSRKEFQKEAIVTKAKNEPLGIVIVESGWGSMLPTVVVANMMPGGPAARGGHLNIGDQIISVNGISLVGLPLSSCQAQIKSVKHLTTVRIVVVPCPPVVEVFIRRPDIKYQLGFSVQNGIICSLLRGGIAERGGVRVGHRIIEINGQSVVATSHDRIVNMLSNSVGELRMKTMPTQMYRLLTGQEAPLYI